MVARRVANLLDAARGKKLYKSTLKAVVGTSLDKGEELDALAKLPPARSKSLIARARAGERITIKQAVKRKARAADCGNARVTIKGTRLNALQSQKVALLNCSELNSIFPELVS